jgi:hypothetical protein
LPVSSTAGSGTTSARLPVRTSRRSIWLARIVGLALAWEPDRARCDAVIATLRARL